MELTTIPIIVGHKRRYYEKISRRRCRLVIAGITATLSASSFGGADGGTAEAVATFPSFSAEYAILISAFVALVCALFTLRANRITQRKILTFNEIHASRRDEILTESMRILIDLHYSSVSINSFAKSIPLELSDAPKKEWLKNRDAIMYVLSHYEAIGTGIALGAYDDRVIYRALYSKIKKTYDACSPYILEIRTKRHRPELYSEMEGMMNILELMEKEEKKSAGKKDGLLARLFS